MRFLSLLLLVFVPMLLCAQVGPGPKTFAGSYFAQSYQKDTILKTMVPVYHRLVLNTDSTFSFSSQSERGHCNQNRAGHWKGNEGFINLDFIGENPVELYVNQGQNYLSLINKKENLVLVRQQPRPHEQGGQHQQPRQQNKKQKEPRCPSF
jgi:hypothetical protein